MKYTFLEILFLKLHIFALRIIMLLRSCLVSTNSVDFLVLQHYCSQHGGHLVHVTNAMENGFITERLRHYARTIRIIFSFKNTLGL